MPVQAKVGPTLDQSVGEMKVCHISEHPIRTAEKTADPQMSHEICSSALITLLIQEKPLLEPLGQNLFSPSCKSLITQ